MRLKLTFSTVSVNVDRLFGLTCSQRVFLSCFRLSVIDHSDPVILVSIKDVSACQENLGVIQCVLTGCWWVVMFKFLFKFC